MKNFKLFLLLIILSVSIQVVFASNEPIKLATPNASPEAKALLKLYYDISGKYTLTGQHNYPNIKGRNTKFAAKYIGKTPVIYSIDWGFAKDGDTDSHLARPNIVEEAKEQHRLGAIVTICWHAVPPTADEPVTFRPQPGVGSPDSLASVQGKLLDRQFKDILTPGTKLYNRWCAQVDTIAFYLKKLQDAHVPILWRPYHEMNGEWFWWGGRVGQNSTIALYRQLFNRLVNYHKLNNLVWVWNVDRPNKPIMQFSNFYPGNDFLDILSLDVYHNDFSKVYYDSLLALSNGKPIIFGEVGNPPNPEILKNQPKWASYVVWSGMVRNTSKKQYEILDKGPRFLYLEDSSYWNVMALYRNSCGLPQLSLKVVNPSSSKIDFSGEWVLNEEKSSLDNMGVSGLPYKLIIAQKDNDLSIKKTFIVEFVENKITDENLTLDGKEIKTEIFNSPGTKSANWNTGNDTLSIESKASFNRDGKPVQMIVNEKWSSLEHGNHLQINQYSSSFWGERKATLVFDKIE
jgi:mannan endo-1,4-beta-mannosidase